MARTGLITLTQVENNRHAAKLREKGWGYYNSRKNQGQDNCAIAWDLDHWHRTQGVIRRLNNRAFYLLNGKPAEDIYAASVVLRHRSGKKMLVSVSNLPAHVEGRDQWATTEDKWRARKEAYQSSVRAWSTHVRDLERRFHTDAALIVGDWNLNLKEDWVRDYLHDRWGSAYRLAWTKFPTEGGSLSGGPSAPAGAPGSAQGDRIIDGSLIRRLKVTDGPRLLPQTQSTDHRPYQETLEFSDKASEHHDAEGDTRRGDAWWGFGDYRDDEIYEVTRATE